MTLPNPLPLPRSLEDDSQTIKTVGAHTFVLKDAIWVDTAYDPDKMTVKKVKFLSEDYFNITSSRPDLAACFALGTHVLVVDQGNAIEIIE